MPLFFNRAGLAAQGHPRLQEVREALGTRLRPTGLVVERFTGVSYNPFADQWRLGTDLDVNDMAFATRALD